MPLPVPLGGGLRHSGKSTRNRKVVPRTAGPPLFRIIKE
jgi:hypothetical protein